MHVNKMQPRRIVMLQLMNNVVTWEETQKTDHLKAKLNWRQWTLLEELSSSLEQEKNSEVSKLTEFDSGVASESQLSASSTDVTPSPTEVNPIANSSNSESKNAALVNKNEDTLVNNCEQQKYVVKYELCLADVHDKENVRRKNGLRSACGISQRMKANSEDGSTQSNAEPQQTEQTKDTAKQQSGADPGATKQKCTDNAGSESLLSTSGERDDSKEVPKRRSLTRGDDGDWVREGSNKSNSQTVYIRIPFSVMAGNESPSSTDTKVTNDHPTYKLIDRVPYLTEIRKRKSYAMLYDNRTKNAAWVYEILNSETLKEEVERKNVFSVDQSIHPFYQTSNGLYQDRYVRGHLAAARNHRWCREACDDTFLMSNISPQHEVLNNGSWNTLENYCQKKIGNNIRNVHVYSGPLYLPRDNDGRVVNYKEMGGKVVPTHFFKVIIVEHNDGTVELECYVMPNDASGRKYNESIEFIERASGLIFRESSCSEGETDSLREVTWTGQNKYDEPCRVTTHVNISTPHK